jgi:hypothetical protein
MVGESVEVLARRAAIEVADMRNAHWSAVGMRTKRHSCWNPVSRTPATRVRL